jgi:hypothetical protein
MTIIVTHMCKPRRKSRAQEKGRKRPSWNSTDNPTSLIYPSKTTLIQLVLFSTACRFHGQLIKLKVCHRYKHQFCTTFSCALLVLFLRGLHMWVTHILVSRFHLNY